MNESNHRERTASEPQDRVTELMPSRPLRLPLLSYVNDVPPDRFVYRFMLLDV